MENAREGDQASYEAGSELVRGKPQYGFLHGHAPRVERLRKKRMGGGAKEESP